MLATVILIVFTSSLIFVCCYSIKKSNDALDATNAWCDAKDELGKYLEEHPEYSEYSEDILVYDTTLVALRKRVSNAHVEFIRTHMTRTSKSYIMHIISDLEPEDQDRVLYLLCS